MPCDRTADHPNCLSLGAWRLRVAGLARFCAYRRARGRLLLVVLPEAAGSCVDRVGLFYEFHFQSPRRIRLDSYLGASRRPGAPDLPIFAIAFNGAHAFRGQHQQVDADHCREGVAHAP
eukprot:3793611-Prymnesium_polylepis.1